MYTIDVINFSRKEIKFAYGTENSVVHFAFILG